MSAPRYLVGIDLGTTNCAVAFVDTRHRRRPSAEIQPVEVPQLVGLGEVAKRSMLPSFLYLPGVHDLPTGAASVPWNPNADRIVGTFARVQGAKVPGRLVASAKSWLCHAGVDREAEILPWGAPAEVRKVSPVEASADFLRHIRDTWNQEHPQPEHQLETQEVLLTVPASFDEAARELTVEASRRAGLKHVTLLEEPQAAFYCWIVSHQEGWQKEVRAGELILVCDIGGGTTDFSLITVVETPTGPGFRRVAVGDHLLLGGDNIDLALAHHVEQTKLGGAKLDAEQWSALRFACRTAKEKLLANDNPAERWPVSIPGRGARVIGGSLQAEISREDAMRIVLDGYFPFTNRGTEPERGGRIGLQEFGLPFVADPALPKHLAAFLRRHRTEAILPGGHTEDDRPARPDAILFNGGALTPAILRDRIVEIVTSWFPEEPDGPYRPRVLTNVSLDLAVAQGAAYYGVVRRGGGIRIGGGTARSFYIGFQAEGQGEEPGNPWLCVVPRDAQEGDDITIEGHDFELLVDQPVAFPLASSSVRPQDKPGDLAPRDPDSIRDLPPLLGVMRVGRKAKAERVPVGIAARVTEIGTIELWCQSRTDDRRWRLQIQLRTPMGGPAATSESVSEQDVLEQSLVDSAIEAIRTAFEGAPPSEGMGPAQLVKRLEERLELPKSEWPPSALRALWEPLREVAPSRENSPRHESRWLNLAGFCLRPGTGFPMDPARIKSLWPVFHQGVKHVKDVQCWAEWWIVWRRVAAGLNRSHHEEVYRRLATFLIPGKGGANPARKANRPKPEAHELAEMWRCAASLERLDASQKIALGDVLLKSLRRPNLPPYVLWCLGRLGARVPLYGPANTAIPRPNAEAWLQAMLDRDFALGREADDARFALAQLARVSGDRARDIDDSLRERVLGRLEALGAEEATLRPVREFHELEAAQQSVALGDALPVGLRLVGGLEGS